MLKVLITGGAGYIGSLLSDYLVRKNFQVTVIDNLKFKKNTIGHLLLCKNFKFIFGDVRNEALYLREIKNNDIILPLAALVGAPLCNLHENEAKEVNEISIDYLFRNLETSQIVIYPTTNSGYGITKKNIVCTEDMPLNPISIYGKTKTNAERILMQRENTICLRLATVFGVSFRNRIDLLINNFVYNSIFNKEMVIYEPEFRRNFIHIRDIIYTFEYCVEKFTLLKNNIYNVGLSSANLTKLELCNEIKKVVKDFNYKISSDGTDPDKRDYFVSNEKLEKTGWLPKISLSDGIKELVQSYNITQKENFDKNI